jgi:hypothetical protein
MKVKKFRVMVMKNGRNICLINGLSRVGAEIEALQWKQHYLNSYNKSDCALSEFVTIEEDRNEY